MREHGHYHVAAGFPRLFEFIVGEPPVRPKKQEDEDGFLMLKLTLNKTWSAYPISKVKKVLSESLLLISRCSVMPITRSTL